MADELIGALRIVLGMDTAQIEEGTKRARAHLNSFAKQVESVFAGTTLSRIVERTFDAIANAIKNTTVEAVKFADEMGKTAQKVGVPVEELSKLAVAAELGDVSMELLSKSLGLLSKQIVEASTGTGKAAEEFRKLGIDVKKTDGTLKSGTDVLTEMAGAFEKTSDGAAKTNSAMTLLGARGGKELIPFLNEGRESLEKWQKAAERMGLVVLPEAAAAADKFNDNLQLLALAKKGLANLVMQEVMPAMVRLTDQWVEAATKGDGVRAIAQKISDAIKGTTTFIYQAIVADELLGKAFNELMQAAAAFGEGTRQVFLRVVDAIKLAWQGVSDIVDRLTPAWIKWVQTLQGWFGKLIDGAIELASKAFPALSKAISDNTDESGDLGKAWRILLELFQTEGFTQAIEKFGNAKEFVAAFGNAMKQAAERVKELFAPLDTLGQKAQGALAAPESALTKELNKLALQARVLAGDFSQLPTGFAEMAAKLELTDASGAKLSTTFAGLTEEQKKLALAMGEVEARQIAMEALDPAAKFELLRQHLEGLGPAFQRAGIDASVLREKIEKEAALMRAAYGAVIASAITPWADAFKTLASMNKKFATAAKALAIGEAIINTYVAANKALASGFPPWNYIAAAGVVAAGLANVAKISGTEFAKGGSFVVPGGISGVDTHTVPLNLAAGERVDITPASESRAASTQIVELRMPRAADFFAAHVRDMVDTLNAAYPDGYVLKMATP